MRGSHFFARDLHDEVGPYLFAIGVDAEAISTIAVARKSSEMLRRTDAIREAWPGSEAYQGDFVPAAPCRASRLRARNRVARRDRFWQRRYPELLFELDIRLAHAEIPSEVGEVAYRIVRESINNAVRHARPNNVAE
jgi:two-component system sensor histidine kinase UhpB